MPPFFNALLLACAPVLLAWVGAWIWLTLRDNSELRELKADNKMLWREIFAQKSMNETNNKLIVQWMIQKHGGAWPGAAREREGDDT